MFLVREFRSAGDCVSPPESCVSGGRSFASEHATTHALHPMQRVVS